MFAPLTGIAIYASVLFALTEKVELALIAAVSSTVSAYFGYKTHASAKRTEALQRAPRAISTDSEAGVFVQPPEEKAVTRTRGKRGKRGGTQP